MVRRGVEGPITDAMFFGEARRAGGSKLTPAVDEGRRTYATWPAPVSRAARALVGSVLSAPANGPVPGSTDTGSRLHVRAASVPKQEKMPTGQTRHRISISIGRCHALPSGGSETWPARSTPGP